MYLKEKNSLSPTNAERNKEQQEKKLLEHEKALEQKEADFSKEKDFSLKWRNRKMR